MIRHLAKVTRPRFLRPGLGVQLSDRPRTLPPQDVLGVN